MDERERLQALRDLRVLDTPPDPALDRLARLTARLLEVPIALVSLVDEERQWFKSRVGLDAQETHRDLAFCDHAIQCPDEVMIVEDAREDRRFRDNALVTGAPDIRFYAGCPLVLRSGAAVGTLCAIDQQPRKLSTEQREILVDLAALVRERLEESHARVDRDLYGRVLEDSLNEVFFFDCHTLRFTRVNRGARFNLGYTREELQEMTPLDIKPKMTAEAFAKLLRPLESGAREKIVFETVHRRKDGTLYDVEVHLQRHVHGTEESYAAIVLDISERRAQELELAQQADALRAARDAAESSAQSKSRFLAMMSHEIRTPMNGIMGSLDLLGEAVLTPDTRELVETMRGCGRSLLVVLDDVLDFSKIDAGQLALGSEPFQPARLVESVGALFEPHADTKNVALSVVWYGDRDRSLIGDPHRLRQVLTNLMSNAIKFTPAGGHVGLAGHLRLAPDGNAVLELTVTDSGIGMSPEQQARIFDPFEQATAGTARDFGGTGLGLSISRKLVELMGGSIDLVSRPGQGSRFRVTAQLQQAQRESAPARQSSTAPVTRPLRILLAEDNSVNQRVATLILERAGHCVVVASNGVEAVEKFSPDAYDVVLMDVHMPRLDGHEAARRILERHPDTDVPIIALTADAVAEERQRCIAAGMRAYLTKPIDRQELLSTIARLAGSDRATTVTS